MLKMICLFPKETIRKTLAILPHLRFSNRSSHINPQSNPMITLLPYSILQLSKTKRIWFWFWFWFWFRLDFFFFFSQQVLSLPSNQQAPSWHSSSALLKPLGVNLFSFFLRSCHIHTLPLSTPQPSMS